MKTTLASFFTGLMIFLHGQFPEYGKWLDAFAGVAVLIFGIVSKDAKPLKAPHPDTKL